MIYNCAKCGLSKSDGAMGSVLPQCKCDWNLTPPKKEWVGLTDEEVHQAYKDVLSQPIREQDKAVVFNVCRAIEAKLKEKNSE